MFKLSATHAPPPDSTPPILWGDEGNVRERLGGRLDQPRSTPLIAVLHPHSVPDTVEFYRHCCGPTQNAFKALPPDKQATYRNALQELWAANNTATDGTTRVEARYIKVGITRHGVDPRRQLRVVAEHEDGLVGPGDRLQLHDTKDQDHGLAGSSRPVD